MQQSKNEELSTEQKIEECLKVIKSFQYFLDEYVYIEDKEAHAAIKLRLWDEQVKIVPMVTDSNLLIILKARQLGLTWLVATYVLWRLLTRPLYLAIIISVTEELSIEFLERIYFILDRLPFWLKPPTKSRTKQVFEIQHGDGLVSTVKSLPCTEMGAQSKTPNLLIMDETCKNRMAKSIYNASYPGIEAAKGQVIIVSNAIKEGAGWYFTRDLYIESMQGMNKFKRIFLPWNAHPLRPKDFKNNMIAAGMEERDVNENFPESEEEAITDRNIKGVYYSKQMTEARKAGRICNIPYVAGYEVYTFWDLGIDDATSIWFMQQIGKEYRFIDYYENTGMGQVHYAKILKEKEYVYGDHYMPHDVEKREMGGDTDVALSIKEISENLGIRPILVVKKAKDSQSVLNSIELGRNILGQCYFDAKKCEKGILCLESYRAEWDEEKDKLDIKPLRNFAIHGSDAFRTFAAGYKSKIQFIPYEKMNRNYNYSNSLSYLGA